MITPFQEFFILFILKVTYGNNKNNINLVENDFQVIIPFITGKVNIVRQIFNLAANIKILY